LALSGLGKKRLFFIIQPVQELPAFAHFFQGRFARERDSYPGENIPSAGRNIFRLRSDGIQVPRVLQESKWFGSNYIPWRKVHSRPAFHVGLAGRANISAIPDFSAVTWPPSVGHVQVNYGAHARGFPLPSVISHKRMTKQRIDKDRRAYERRQSPKGKRRQFPPQR
jgi:hypothetical protein